jgi:glycosyltransferase involved in cell wall biosynthesis
LIANSHAGAADYAEWLEIEPERFTVIHNGLDVGAFIPPGAADRAATRARLGVDADAFLVAGVFRLDTEKAPLEFLRVVAEARKRIPTLAAVHVGVGLLGDEVRAEAKNLGLDGTLRFLGRVADPSRILGAADVSVLTSLCEGCPNAVLESQALEVPVVVTRSGGSPEAVDDGRTGYVVDVGDVTGLVSRLEELARDPELRARLGRAGRRFVAERFSLQDMVKKTLALYRASDTDPVPGLEHHKGKEAPST